MWTARFEVWKSNKTSYYYCATRYCLPTAQEYCLGTLGRACKFRKNGRKNEWVVYKTGIDKEDVRVALIKEVK